MRLTGVRRRWASPAAFAGLSDGNSAFNRNRDELSFGVDADLHAASTTLRRAANFTSRSTTTSSQQNPRGAFSFTGAATQGAAAVRTSGSDLADFLIGVPDASAIAFGNADKYFREPVYNAYFTDDWRVLPILTINAGLRWDYSAPITELFGRLVNLDVANGFTAAAPVVGSDPVGTVTRRPLSVFADPAGAAACSSRASGSTWRPIPASTVVIRAGYGIYPDTSVYQGIVLRYGAAGSALDEPECPEQRGVPAHAG